MATNVGFDYQRAEEEYRNANTPAEKMNALQKMLRLVPKHKATENLQASIKERISKLKQQSERAKSNRASGYTLSVRREGAAQICLVGTPNSGKSTLLKQLTGAQVDIADYPFTTKKPEIGILDYCGLKLQLVEIPAITEDFEDTTLGPTLLSIIGQTDLVILLFHTPEEKTLLDKELANIPVTFLVYNGEDKEKLSEEIWKRLDLIKIYTKQPGKERDYPPVAFPEGSTVRDAAKKVHKDFLKRFRYAKVTGTSAKFPAQRVGLDHVLADDDIVELHMS